MNKLGQEAEQIACQHLQSNGLKLLERNYSCKCGEIDLIMKDQDFIVFIEVKYRKNNDYGYGSEFVNRHKQLKISKTALYYLQARKLYEISPCRFDVISISKKQTLDSIQWIQSAFDANY